MRVYKYALNHGGVTGLHLPLNAKVLTVGVQDNEPFLWALIDPAVEFVHYRTFLLIGTGEDVEHVIIAHIGTFLILDGTGVFHVFEVKP